ncbi:putative mitochondrial protein AtMg00860 [Silene latifolia]|uniref:putative mitochondrial protein AtMg00860 n=1 Tax=Silene latifolia TaxID=37657 RepID=UPI003D773AEB
MDVVKKEVLKLLHVGMIYPISDSQWVSPTQVVPKTKPTFFPGLNVGKVHDEYLFDHVDDFIEVFMDDFTVHGQSFEDCLSHLTWALQSCIDTNLVLNHEKCHFMVNEGIVLGHVLSSRGIEVDKAKVDTIRTLPYPTNVREVRSFLGHAGFYRRFIKDFSKIVAPLCKLLQKDCEFIMSEERKEAFDMLKEKLISAPIIQPPNWSEAFEIMSV